MRRTRPDRTVKRLRLHCFHHETSPKEPRAGRISPSNSKKLYMRQNHEWKLNWLYRAVLIFTICPLSTKVSARSIVQAVEDRPEWSSGSTAVSIDPAHRSSGYSKDPLMERVELMMIILPVVIAIIGLSMCLWTLIRRDQSSKQRDFLWLMSFMASVCWWVFDASARGPSSGKSLSIATWVALLSNYWAYQYRGLRNGRQYVFTSLLGGVFATAIVAAIAMLASSGVSKSRPPSMKDFAGQTLTVGPTIATIWSLLVGLCTTQCRDPLLCTG